MNQSQLHSPIEYLKGIGPQRAEVLKKELRIYTFQDLLHHFPFRYVDKSIFHKIEDIPKEEGYVQLKGRITQVSEVGSGRGKRLQAKFQDETGVIELIWFKGIKWIKSSLNPNIEFIVYGKPKVYGSKWNISHPDIDPYVPNPSLSKNLQPIYNSSEKLSQKNFHSKGIEKAIKTLLPLVKDDFYENLPHWIVGNLGLMGKKDAMIQIHAPQSLELAKKAQLRIKFEELFFLQLELLTRKLITQNKIKSFPIDKVGEIFNTFYENHIPFELTNAQKRVVKEIRKDMLQGMHMNRLLQGDVGSGKTLVAFLVMLLGVDNGFQCCLMAPTEILAQQHYQTLKEFAEKLDIKIDLLTGSTKKAERTIIHESLLSGETDILIGTHALIEPTVNFKNLGIAVIDEQHRFGVAQRSKLWKKNALPPHVLVMTATPIPRTLALTFYGDLDVSVIDELPLGRKPIQTFHYFEKSRLKIFQFIEDEIKKGRQVYIVYPLIDESEKMDYANLLEGYESITRRFPLPQYSVSIVHGKMKPQDKEYEMKLFAEGKTNIMVATTVIEVGVNVPNASIMIIESAEKFGLSQLHQLRGRVGRGAEQSYCVLVTGYKLSEDAKVRLETMVRTQDGFEISEVDLRLRGPGDIMGTKQSGILDLKLADLSRDGQIVSLARDKARELLEKDPKLEYGEHLYIRNKLKEILSNKPNWSRIS